MLVFLWRDGDEYKIQIFKWLKEYSEKQMKKNYLKPRGGCDSCCPKYSEEHPELDHRTCANWFAIFTPAGFIEVKPDDEKG